MVSNEIIKDKPRIIIQNNPMSYGNGLIVPLINF